jgi:hypothetical protein
VLSLDELAQKIQQVKQSISEVEEENTELATLIEKKINSKS